MGVKKSEEEAVKYFKMAADLNDAWAQSWLSSCYKLGAGVKHDEKEAFRYAKLAADQGLPIDQCFVADAYERGIVVEKSVAEAFKYYQLAAKSDHAEAFFHIGRFYQVGQYVEQSLAKALDYFRLSVEKGYEKAQSQIEVCKELLEKQKQSSLVSIIDPQAENLNIGHYLESHNLALLKDIFEKSKEVPIFLEASHLSNDELEVICNAMIANHRLAFICSHEDMENLMRIFQKAGHHSNNLWRQKLKKQDTQEIVYGLRFREEKIAA